MDAEAPRPRPHLHDLVFRFRKSILASALVLTLLAALFATRLKLDLDFFNLLPRQDPAVASYFRVAKGLFAHAPLIVLVKTPQGLSPARGEALVEDLARGLSGIQGVRSVTFRADQRLQEQGVHLFLERLTAFLTSQELALLGKRLTDEGIRERVAENRRLLSTPLGAAAEELLVTDPLGIARAFFSRRAVRGAGGGMGAPGFFYSAPDRTYFLFVRCDRPPQDVTFSKGLMAEAGKVVQDAVGAWQRGASVGSRGRVEISYAGGYPIAVRDEAQSRRDIQMTLITSLAGVLLLFGLSFRRAGVLLCGGLTLLVGLLWTLAFGALVFGSLNVISFTFSCVLIGLGVDFAIHVANRYYEDDGQGGARDALERVYREAGGGILVGGITTAVAFFAVGVSDFGGFRQLGLLTGTGILFCMLAMLFVLPALLAVGGGRGGGCAVAGFGLFRLVGIVHRRAGTVLWVSAAIITALGFFAARVRFDDNLRHFRPPGDEAFLQQGKVREWLGGSLGRVLLVSEARSEGALLSRGARMLAALEKARNEGLITRAESIARFFQPPEVQARNLEYLRAHRDVFDPRRVRMAFSRALQAQGFGGEVLFEPAMNALSRGLSTQGVILPSSLKGTEAWPLVARFWTETDAGFRLVIHLTPAKDLWTLEETEAFREGIHRALSSQGIAKEDYLLTGAGLLTADLKALLLRSLRSSLWLASLSIACVLFFYYRSLKFLCLSALPLAAGLCATAGVMALLDVDFDFFNLVVIPMIVGIGIDDGVHMANTYRVHRGPESARAVAHTGRAVVLTSLTTLVGFGSISLSHYPGLRGMGTVAVMGISACLLASLLLLPAVFGVLNRKSRP